MKSVIRAICLFYGWMLRLYPPGFRAAFGDEMEAVFAEAVTEAGAQGLIPLVIICLRELRDWPGALGAAYRHGLSRRGSRIRAQGGIMGIEEQSKKGGFWAIEDRGRAWLAALPPLIMGVGTALAALPNGRSWFELTVWQQVLVIGLAALPTGVLAVGGLIALVRSIPEWGYAWAASALVGAAMLLKIWAEERAEVGAFIVSPTVDLAMVLVLVLAGGVVLVIAALRGWAQAGLTSIGFVATFGISVFSMVRAAPFHRSDLVLFAAPLGLLQGVLTYLYVRGRGDRSGRWGYLLGVWVLNSVPILLAYRVWQPWLAARGQTSPLVPLLVMVTVLAWAGPLAGLVGKPVRRSLGRR